MKERIDGKKIPVYPIDPLLDAGERLFGTNQNRRFHLLAGAHVICAYKSKTVKGPDRIWCALAIGIAEDRQKDANLFMKDCGNGKPSERILENLAESIMRCGNGSNVKFKKIFVGYKEDIVPKDHVGCGLACVPYVVVARNAIPKGKKPEDLLNMKLSEWEKALNLRKSAERPSVNK